jgi:hypothetical protein
MERDKISLETTIIIPQHGTERNGTGTVWEFPRHHPHLLPSEKVLVRKVATIIRITETEQGCLALDRSYAHLHVGPRSMAAYPISPVSGTRPARGSLHVRATNKPYRHITVPSHTRHRTSPSPVPCLRGFAVPARLVWLEQTSRLAPCVITKYDSSTAKLRLRARASRSLTGTRHCRSKDMQILPRIRIYSQILLHFITDNYSSLDELMTTIDESSTIATKRWAHVYICLLLELYFQDCNPTWPWLSVLYQIYALRLKTVVSSVHHASL